MSISRNTWFSQNTTNPTHPSVLCWPKAAVDFHLEELWVPTTFDFGRGLPCAGICLVPCMHCHSDPQFGDVKPWAEPSAETAIEETPHISAGRATEMRSRMSKGSSIRS